MKSKFEQIKTVASKNPQILVCGGAMNNVIKIMAKAQADYIDQKMREELEIFDVKSEISALVGTSSIEFLIDETTFEPPKEDISSLKKRIKHCKNHMEKQRLQKELNALYKEQKKGRR